MPCNICHRRKSRSNGHHITYCNCGACNHCHCTGLCPDHKHWYLNIKKGRNIGKHRKKYIPGQSHGGHRWVPDCWCNC